MEKSGLLYVYYLLLLITANGLVFYSRLGTLSSTGGTGQAQASFITGGGCSFLYKELQQTDHGGGGGDQQFPGCPAA